MTPSTRPRLVAADNDACPRCGRPVVSGNMRRYGKCICWHYDGVRVSWPNTSRRAWIDDDSTLVLMMKGNEQ